MIKFRHHQHRPPFAVAATSFTTLALVLSACAGGEPPTTQLELARQAVDEASRNGAAERAPQTFIMAREKLARAEEASKGESYDEARRFAEESAADAQLAGAQARTAAAEQAVTSVRAGNTTLQQEITPTTRAPLPGTSTAPSTTGVPSGTGAAR
jgi:hypothetical protein